MIHPGWSRRDRHHCNFPALDGAHGAIRIPCGRYIGEDSYTWGFLLLVPALMAAGGSAFALAKSRRAGLVGEKIKRMPLIAANGILVLIPSALFLGFKARAAEFDAAFYAVQALELAAGAVNIALLGLNMRDGLKIKGGLRSQVRAVAELRKA